MGICIEFLLQIGKIRTALPRARRIAGLGHEAFDHAMEDDAIVKPRRAKVLIRSTWLGARSGRNWIRTRPPSERSRSSTFSGSTGTLAAGLRMGAGFSAASCAITVEANSKIGRASCRERVGQYV